MKSLFLALLALPFRLLAAVAAGLGVALVAISIGATLAGEMIGGDR